MKPIRILSLPSYHPLMSRFNDGKNIVFVNPNCDFFAYKDWCTKQYLNRNFPLNSYDLVHIYMEYYLISVPRFKKLLLYFKNNKKKIIWTWSDKKSLLDENIDYSYEKLLFKYTDKIISPSFGMRRWIISNFGQHANSIETIPYGYFAHPNEVQKISQRINKDKNLFTMLVGDFRDSKEYIQSILNFLHCTDLQKAKLKLIFRPMYVYKKRYKHIREELINFHQLIQNSRISVLCRPEISDQEITEALYNSHVIILPYRWGDHSGQIELAKDCGCHVVVPDIGYYQEQWDKLIIYKISDKNYSQIPARYTKSLIKAFKSKSLRPMGFSRIKEFRDILNKHIQIYRNLIKVK